MATDPSLWSFIANASLVVKLVLLILAVTSIVSWTMIFQRGRFLKQARLSIRKFEERFWAGTDLGKLYDELKPNREALSGLAHIFYAGFNEFNRLRNSSVVNADAIMQGAERSMRIALAQEVDKLEQNLSFLATVGSTSPYVGLFGTVWGIMTAFRSLGAVQQATISMVAPGISEALIATAMGLFAAIPAVISYNHYANAVERLTNHYYTFQDEFSAILHRQAHAQ
ncbi:MAG: protein TolQ [Gammaproteobacteria bacterium]|nr:protein TolQ [Gammaproteobacteria bacterium]